MKDFDLLSEDESRLKALLIKADPRTPWGSSIHDAEKEGTAAAFRKLVEQLRSQAEDCQDVMVLIIGEEALGVLLGKERGKMSGSCRQLV